MERPVVIDGRIVIVGDSGKPIRKKSTSPLQFERHHKFLRKRIEEANLIGPSQDRKEALNDLLGHIENVSWTLKNKYDVVTEKDEENRQNLMEDNRKLWDTCQHYYLR